MDNNYDQKVRERAFFKYLKRIEDGVPFADHLQDWKDACREQGIQERIEQEAYFHYLNGGNDSVANWTSAEREIIYRLRLLAYYIHEADYNSSPTDNWVKAQDLYLSRF